MPLSEPELEKIEQWAAKVLEEYEIGLSFPTKLCVYSDLLPSHSIRSQMLALVAEMRRLQAEAEEREKETEKLLDKLMDGEGELRLAVRRLTTQRDELIQKFDEFARLVSAYSNDRLVVERAEAVLSSDLWAAGRDNQT